MPWLGISNYAAPALRGPDWVRLRPLMAGICGSDLALITGKASDRLSPFASFPAVLGHETVAVVEEAGSRAGVAVGQRVAIDPVISCLVRGLESCAYCRDGRYALCQRAAEGDLAPGMMMGFCRDLPGGWSEAMLAHASQLHPLPEGVSDEIAVLVEPMAIVLHAVLLDPPAAGERVLVIGGGTIGLGTVAALKVVAAGAEVTAVVRHPVQAALAERLGAARTVIDRGGRGAFDAAAEGGATVRRTLTGAPALTGGFDRVYDCVGSAASIDAALGTVLPGGRVMLIGGAFELEHLDLTLAWAHELRVSGSYGYGWEPTLPGAPHTFDYLLRLIGEHPELPLAEFVTHRFPLDRWRDALRTAMDRRGSGSVKVVFDHRGAR